MAGRPRPCFYAMCGWVANSTTGAACTAPKLLQWEARQSFPSGHSSFSMAGLAFLGAYQNASMTLNPKPADKNAHTHTFTPTHTHTHTTHTGMYFLDKCDQLQRPPRFTTPLQLQAAQLCSLLPFAVALWVAISRTVDYWHHYSDVIAGSLLGFAIAHVRCLGREKERERERERERMHARTGKQDAERNRLSLSRCVSMCVTVYAHACVNGFGLTLNPICARVRLCVCVRALREAELAPEHQRQIETHNLNP